MEKEVEREEVDGLCPECGHGFKAYVDRIAGNEKKSELMEGVPCPVCGCGECKIIHPGSS